MDDERSKLLADVISARESTTVLRELTNKQRRLVVDTAWGLHKGLERIPAARVLELLGEKEEVSDG